MASQLLSNQPAATQVVQPIPIKPESAFKPLRQRYTDAYRVANFLMGVGNFEKGASILLAFGVFMYAMLGPGQELLANPQTSAVPLLLWLGISVIVGLLGFVLGVYTCAKAELILTSSDCAVNSSPLLTAEEKGQIIGIR